MYIYTTRNCYPSLELNHMRFYDYNYTTIYTHSSVKIFNDYIFTGILIAAVINTI